MAGDAPRVWFTWIGGAVAIGLVAFGGGALGLFGRPAAQPPAVEVVGAVPSAAMAFDCPGGLPLIQLREGDRVLALAQSADGAWIAIRSPVSDFETVWVLGTQLSVVSAGELPVDGCLAPTIEPVQP